METIPSGRLLVALFSRDRPNFLRAALNSICRQTYRDFSVLVSDNSTQERNAAQVSEICDEYRCSLPALTYVRQSGQLGIAEHFYTVYHKHAIHFKMLAVHNDDDIWLSWHLRIAIEALEQGADLFVGNCAVVDSGGRIAVSRFWGAPHPPPERGGNALRFWLRWGFAPYPGYVLRTAVLEGIPQIETLAIDIWIAIWVLAQGGITRCEIRRTFLYRQHASQLSTPGTAYLEKARHRLRLDIVRQCPWTILRRDPSFVLRVLKSWLYLKAHDRSRPV